MAVSEAMIGYVSPYTVADGTAFPSALFDYYSPIAATMLANEGGADLPVSLYDHCHALLIAHLYAVKGGETALLSFSSGDVQWAKSVTMMEKGTTPFLLEVREIIAQQAAADAGETMTADMPLADIQRADADVGNLRLDRASPITFFRGL
jgi:hypothetical protein